jgi:hypothetical protein
LWNQSDDVIKAALDSGFVENMGVNVIRQYTGIPQNGLSTSMKIMVFIPC